MTEKFHLAEHERQTQLWRDLMRYVEGRLDELRRLNDGDKDERATATLRGRIAELKLIAQLGDPPRTP